MYQLKLHAPNATVVKMVKRHSVLKNPIKPKWTFSVGFAYLFFPHQTTLIWFFSLLLLLFPNIDINFVPPSFACILHDRGDKINMHSDGRIKKKFQMLFEQNVVSNVTSNQEPLHKILLKRYFFVQIPLVGAFWAKI